DDSVTMVGKLATFRSQIFDLRNKLKHAGETKTQTNAVLRPKGQTEQHRQTIDSVAPSGIYTFEDSLKGPPADVKAAVNVVIGPKQVTADWGWQTKPWPIPIAVNIGCRGRLNPDVLVETPKWIEVDSVQTKVADNVCGEPVKKPSAGKTILKIGVLVG